MRELNIQDKAIMNMGLASFNPCFNGMRELNNVRFPDAGEWIQFQSLF